MYYILTTQGEAVGQTLTAIDLPADLYLVADFDYHPDPAAALAAGKAAKLHEASAAAQPCGRFGYCATIRAGLLGFTGSGSSGLGNRP